VEHVLLNSIKEQLDGVRFSEVINPDGDLEVVCFVSYGECLRKLSKIKEIVDKFDYKS
jgi:hypothetical protein